MKVKLIPVIELTYYNKDIESPSPKGCPYWENEEEWSKYRNRLYEQAGFKDKFIPYSKGSPFFEPKNISDRNLEKIILDNVKHVIEDRTLREQLEPLYGGYVLNIDGEDKFFPQCCGDLGDILFWEKLSDGERYSYEGHPVPEIFASKETIFLDFTVGEFDEHFDPTPPNLELEFQTVSLKKAVKEAK